MLIIRMVATLPVALFIYNLFGLNLDDAEFSDSLFRPFVISRPDKIIDLFYLNRCL